MTTFFAGDLHFNQSKITQSHKPRYYFKNVEENNEAIAHIWNSLVSPNDEAWLLGDIFFNKDFDIINRLNGKKYLVMGNHDDLGIKNYIPYFEDIFGAKKFMIKGHKCILTHIPVQIRQFERYKLNIHGHNHRYLIDDPRYFNTNIDMTGLRPTPIEIIEQRLEEIYN